MLVNNALLYAKNNFKIIPLKPRSKVPLHVGAYKDGSTDEAQIRAWWQECPEANIGFVCDPLSGYWVFDVDREYGRNDYRELIKRHGSFKDVPFQRTPNGIHFFFKRGQWLDGFGTHKLFPHPQNPNGEKGKDEGIDLKIAGGHIVIAPSIHPDGEPYEMQVDPCLVPPPDAPDWLIDCVVNRRAYIDKWGFMAPIKENARIVTANKTAKKKQLLELDREEFSEADVQDMLSVLDPDMQREDWVQVGMALHDGGYSFKLFDDWSKSNGATKYNAKNIVTEWNSFQQGVGVSMGSLVYMAKLNGWSPNYKHVDFEIKKNEPERKIIVKEKTAIEEGFNISDIDGLIGDTVDDICKSAFIPQPYLALLNVLAFAGALLGGRYATPLGGRTNLYTIGVAPTGLGKDASRKYITSLSHELGRDELIGSNALRSASGLAQEVKANPSVLLQIDEFGLFMKGLADERAPAYVRELSKLMLILYSSADSIYNHGCYADTKIKPVVIKNPNLCIYGTTTFDNWTDNLTSANVKSGELNRFIVLPSGVEPKNNHGRRFSLVSPDLISQWQDAFPHIATIGTTTSAPISAKWGAGVQKATQDMADYQLTKVERENTGALWARYVENSLKLALILAVCRNPTRPVIEQKDLSIGASIVKKSILFMEKIVAENMAENPYERELNAVMSYVSKNGSDGVARSALYNQFRRMKVKGLDEILSGLMEAGMVESLSVTVKGSKRPTAFYRAIN